MGNAFAKDAHGRPPDLLEMKNATSIPRTERNREDKMQERLCISYQLLAKNRT